MIHPVINMICIFLPISMVKIIAQSMSSRRRIGQDVVDGLLAILRCPISYPASRVSLDLPRLVGKRKETLRASSTFRVEHVLKIQTYSGVSHARLVTAKPQNQKKTVGIFSNNSGKNMTTKESFPSKLKIVQVFKLPFQFLLKKINRFLNSGKLVSVTDIRRKYS